MGQHWVLLKVLLKAPRSALRSVLRMVRRSGWHLGQHWVMLKVLDLSWAPQKKHRLERCSD